MSDSIDLYSQSPKDQSSQKPQPIVNEATIFALSEYSGHGENNSAPSTSQNAQTIVVKQERSCWICFETDEENRFAEWVQPCKCCGTTKWVHQSCLHRWIDEKQKDGARKVSCQQCKTEYIIVFPHTSKFANLLEIVDNNVKTLSPFMAASLCVSAFYFSAITYGAVALMQVVGPERGFALMENGDPLIIYICLPAIPTGLVLARMIKWEDAILQLIRNRRRIFRKLPLLNMIISQSEEVEEVNVQEPSTPLLANPISATRVICGALMLPTISSIVGSLLFYWINKPLHRSLLGGLTFIVVKGTLRIYMKQQQFARKKHRRIFDYSQEHIEINRGRNMNDSIFNLE